MFLVISSRELQQFNWVLEDLTRKFEVPLVLWVRPCSIGRFVSRMRSRGHHGVYASTFTS